MHRLIFYLFLVLSFSAYSNELDGNFINFNFGNGHLMHNTVEAITRDNFGYVWVGTNYGLSRLDGYHSVNFTNDPDNLKTISSNHIKVLFTDSSDDLWIGTIGGGLNKFLRNSNEFIYYLPNDTCNSISSNNISAITEDLDGNIWIGTYGKAINKLDKKTGLFTFFDLEKYDPFQRYNTNIYSLFCDKAGFIWAGATNSELYRIDPKTNNVQFFNLSHVNEASDIGSITGIAQTKNGELIFSTWYGHLFILYPNTNFNFQVLKYPQYFNFSVLSDIKIDHNENLWVSTWNNGLYKIDLKNNTKQHLQLNNKIASNLISNSINRLFIDKEQNLWTCYLDKGISLLSLKEKMFKSLDLSNDKFNFQNVFSIIKDNNENLWIGSRGQGLWKYNLKTKETVNYLAEDNSGLSNSSILTLEYSKDNKLLIGTDGNFLNILDLNTNKFTAVKQQANNWSSAVFAIAENDNFIFAGTWGGGIKKIDKKTLTYTSINFDVKDLLRNSIFDLDIIDSTLWIANVGIGLIKYNLINDSYKIYNKSENYPGFPIERINDIHVENYNSLWLSTDGGGCFHFIPSTEKITNITKNYNISNNVIQSVITDKNNELWISTFSGIIHIKSSMNKFYDFNSHNGINNTQLNKSTTFFDKESNIIYTGGVEGVNYFNPDNIIIDSLVNEVIITGIDIMGKNIFYPNHTNLSKSIDVADTLYINNKEKVITIHFSSMEFTPSMKSRYFYQLEGFSDKWIESPYKTNFVQYTNLFPGEYTFRIKACNGHGICNENETTLKIIVRPAFWQTLLFKILILLIVIILIFLYTRERYQTLLNAKKSLEINVSERTSEIQKQKDQIEKQNKDLEIANGAKNKFFSIISHDLRNPLSTIDQLIQLINMQYGTASEEKMRSYFDMLKNASTRTIELLDDLLIWARTQTNRITIKKANIQLDELFYGVASYCYPLAQKKKIELVIPLHIKMNVFVDKNTIQTVLRNLITNAIKFSHENSKVTIHVEDKNDNIVISVRDNGIGLTKLEKENLFKIENLFTRTGTNGETGTGLGLILCYEFLALNNGKIWVESEHGKGSTFSFSISKSI